MKHTETTWKTKDGLEIYSQIWEPVSPQTKVVVCNIHGHGEHSGRYAHVAEAFGQNGYAFFSMDLRGHGRSGGARGDMNSIEDFMQDIDSLIDHARSTFKGFSVILYGHSLGAVLVLYYTLLRKPDVKGVIATSPSLHTAVEEQKAKLMAVKILGSLMPKTALPSGIETAALSRDADVVKAYVNDPMVHDQISLGLGKIILGVNKHVLDHAADFPVPLLLIHGKEDRIAYPSSSVEFAQGMKENYTLVLRDGGYHELHNESMEKEEVFKTMTIWMDARIRA